METFNNVISGKLETVKQPAGIQVKFQNQSILHDQKHYHDQSHDQYQRKSSKLSCHSSWSMFHIVREASLFLSWKLFCVFCWKLPKAKAESYIDGMTSPIFLSWKLEKGRKYFTAHSMPVMMICSHADGWQGVGIDPVGCLAAIGCSAPADGGCDQQPMLSQSCRVFTFQFSNSSWTVSSQVSQLAFQRLG